MANMTRNSGLKADGTFGPRKHGKPKRARHKATPAALALLDGEVEAMTKPSSQQAVTLPLCQAVFPNEGIFLAPDNRMIARSLPSLATT
jgi:hypothetical protein